MTAAYRLAQAGVARRAHTSAPPISAASSARSTSTATTSTASTTSCCRPTTACSALAEELGLGDDTWRFRPTKVGFYDDGRLFSMTSPKEFLRFPLLQPAATGCGSARSSCAAAGARATTSSTTCRCSAGSSSSAASGVVERLWDRSSTRSSTAATTTCRPPTSGRARAAWPATRDCAGREIMGWLRRRLPALIDALAVRIRELGGDDPDRHGGRPIVERRRRRRDRPRVGGSSRRFDHVLCTLRAAAGARRSWAPSYAAAAPADHCRYLGVRVPARPHAARASARTTTSTSPTGGPLTTVVETTHVVDPEPVGGHLLYVTKYVDPSTPTCTAALDERRARLPRARADDLPRPRDDDILGAVVQRARAVEPVHLVGGAKRLPTMFPARAGPGVDARTCTPRSSTARRCIGVAEQRRRGHPRPRRGRDVPSATAPGGHVTSAVATPARVRTRSRARRASTPTASPAAPRSLFASCCSSPTGARWGNLDQDTGYDIVAGARRRRRRAAVRRLPLLLRPARAPPGRRWRCCSAATASARRSRSASSITALILAATYVAGAGAARPARRLPGDRAEAAVAFVPANFAYVLPHTIAATLGTLALLGLLLARGPGGGALAAGALAARGRRGRRPQHADEARVRARGGGRRRRVARSSRRHASAAPWRDAALVAAPAARRSRSWSTARWPSRRAVSRDLLFENLYPVDMLARGGDAILRARMPMTVVELRRARRAARAVRGRRGGDGDRRAAASPAAGARRVAGVVLRGARRPGARRARRANPEALRHGLQFVYGWIPLGAAVARRPGSSLRERRSASPWSADAQLTLASTVVLAVLASTHLQRVLPALRRLADGRVLRAVRARAARAPAPRRARPRPRGGRWSARRGSPSSSPPATALTLSDAKDETARCTARRLDPAPASDAAAFQGAVDAIAANTRPGEPILAAPMLTGLYVLAERAEPAPRDRRCCPAATPPADEQRCDRASRRGRRPAGVTRPTPWSGYGQTPSATRSTASSAAGSAATSRACGHSGGTAPAARRSTSGSRR